MSAIAGSVAGMVAGARDGRIVRRVVRSRAAPLEREWPATIPAVAQVLAGGLELRRGVTLLVGENGSGKSTLVEALAMAYGLGAEGGTANLRVGTRPSESPLHDWITLERSPGAPRWGFFLRAETMHGWFTRLEAFDESGADSGLHEMSHGESFLEVLRTRFRQPGLYLLDEPEAALSFRAQVALVSVLHELGDIGAQVVCATHSPLLAALPGATILELGDHGLREVAWSELDLVTHWRAYLDEPMRYLRHVLDD
ncbi:AAA family ATPase [Nocardioides aestuarii]|uniref:AAA family ATPase n=1 Tax=Nocardioides aestuarii TaxID=252231 RepID=A0ABW4TK80_9ACTN